MSRVNLRVRQTKLIEEVQRCRSQYFKQKLIFPPWVSPEQGCNVVPQPPARSSQGSECAGLYASDRDMFAFLVNDEKPIEIGNAKLSRGFFLWNSETGAASFGLTTFLYNYVCGNHIVWGAEEVDELKIIHRLNAPDRFQLEATPMLTRFAKSRTLSNTVTVTVTRAMEERIGVCIEDVLKWFASKPFTKSEAVTAFQLDQAESDEDPTVWGMVQGLTAHARELKHADARVDLERRAGGLLYSNWA